MRPCKFNARLLSPCGFSRKEYSSGLPCPPPGDLPNPGIKPRSPTLQADSLLSEPPATEDIEATRTFEVMIYMQKRRRKNG